MSDDFKCCPICREYGFMSGSVLRHRCKPEWECRGEWETDEDWEKTYAVDASQAAEKFSEYYDANGGEYGIVGRKFRNDVIVLVRSPSDCMSVQRFAIEAEARPHYSATEMSE